MASLSKYGTYGSSSVINVCTLCGSTHCPGGNYCPSYSAYTQYVQLSKGQTINVPVNPPPPAKPTVWLAMVVFKDKTETSFFYTDRQDETGYMGFKDARSGDLTILSRDEVRSISITEVKDAPTS